MKYKVQRRVYTEILGSNGVFGRWQIELGGDFDTAIGAQGYESFTILRSAEEGAKYAIGAVVELNLVEPSAL